MAAPLSSRSQAPYSSGLRIVLGGDGNIGTMRLKGECDLAHREAVGRAASRAMQSRPVDLVLDLSEVSFIDSSGIHALVELAEHAAQHRIRLSIVPGPPAVQRVFQICGLDRGLPFTGRTSISGAAHRDGRV